MIHSVQERSKPVFRFFKEIYLTAFAIFFRLGGADWTPDINAWKGVVGIALIEGLVLLATEGWIEILAGTRFLPHLPKSAVVIVFLALSFANYYVLVICRHGVVFEREFTNLTKSRKVLLVASCVVMMLIAIAFFIYSASTHRRFIGVDKP